MYKRIVLFPLERFKPYHVLQRIILRALHVAIQKLRWHQDGGAAIFAE